MNYSGDFHRRSIGTNEVSKTKDNPGAPERYTVKPKKEMFSEEEKFLLFDVLHWYRKYSDKNNINNSIYLVQNIVKKIKNL